MLVELPRGPLAAPERFRVWAAGNNPGDYGDNLFTEAAAARVMTDFERRGVAGAIDIEHATNPKAATYSPEKAPVMGGYYGLKVVQAERGPELWADPVRWSDCGRPAPVPSEICCAKHQIESGQRCYISPDWQFDAATKEPLCLNKLSLVAEPGTYGINLLASRASASRREPMDLEMMKQLLAMALGLADSSSDPELKRLAADFAKSLGDKASALGIDPSAAPASEAPAAAAATDPQKDPPGVPAAAGGDCAPGQDPKGNMASRGKPLTEADVTRIMNQDRERREILAANRDRPGMTEPLANLLASKSLQEVRQFVAALPPRPAAPTAQNATASAAAGAITGPVPLAGGAPPAGPMTIDEQFAIKRLGAIMSPDASVLADVRTRQAAGKPIGVIDRPTLVRLAAARKAAKS